MIERLEEGWLKFSRTHCTEGYIDKWRGDSINDPNNDNESNLQLNMTSTYYRLNGKGNWIHSDDMKRQMSSMLYSYSKLFTSKEIWSENLK